MGELIHLQVGQCGNRVGARYWEMVCAEHGLDTAGTPTNDSEELAYGRSVSFNETSTHTFTPRTVLVDMEPGTLDTIRTGPCSRLFPSDSYVYDQVGTGKLFPNGHYGVGGEFAYAVMDAVRHLVETCDSFQGIQLFHSLGGGTGSGLGTLLISKIREEYCDRVMSTCNVIPTNTVSDCVVEPYNTCLAIHQLVENSDIAMEFDNRALLDLCTRKLAVESPTYADFNHLAASMMCGVTCPMRFKGSLNSNLRKMAVNLIPFPRLHFFTSILAPLCGRNSAKQEVTVSQVMDSLLDYSNCMNSFRATEAWSPSPICAAFAFRGDISSYEVEHGLAALPARKREMYRDWLPDTVSSSICSTPSLQSSVSASVIINSDIIAKGFQRNLVAFKSLFRRKAFLYRYTGAGMDEMELVEAESNASDLIAEYEQTCAYSNPPPEDLEEIEE